MQEFSQRTPVFWKTYSSVLRKRTSKSVKSSLYTWAFLSPDGYTSGHVAHIQLYTCHHPDPSPLERHFYSSSYLTKLPMRGVTTASLERDPLSGEYGVSPCTPSLWSRLPLSRSASLAHRVCSGKLFPCLDLLPGNDHLITSSFVLVPLESLKQAFLTSRRCSPLRRSLTTWSPKTHIRRLWRKPGDRRLYILEIGERQPNDWRLHRLPDVLPFCQPGIPLNTPILSLAATSSLPITWSVHLHFYSLKYNINN